MLKEARYEANPKSAIKFRCEIGESNIFGHLIAVETLYGASSDMNLIIIHESGTVVSICDLRYQVVTSLKELLIKETAKLAFHETFTRMTSLLALL
jgi:predicted lipoprotein